MTTQHAAVTSTGDAAHSGRKRKLAVDLWVTRCSCSWVTHTHTLAEADRRLAAHRASVSA
jgi:hypothetical protein